MPVACSTCEGTLAAFLNRGYCRAHLISLVVALRTPPSSPGDFWLDRSHPKGAMPQCLLCSQEEMVGAVLDVVSYVHWRFGLEGDLGEFMGGGGFDRITSKFGSLK